MTEKKEPDIPATGGLLQGVGVLVTRPGHQADALCRMIEAEGGRAVRFPVLEIRGPADETGLLNAIRNLESYHWAIFISVNANNRGMQRVLAGRSWPDSVRIAVIGRRSAREAELLGCPADLVPEQRFDSEGLLALPEMQAVQGQRIAIFRGNGGRELLAEQLRARGAEVDYVETYRRVCPSHNNVGDLLRRWQAGEIQITLVNSAESLSNLEAMLGQDGQQLLQSTPLVVVSERMLSLARKAGFVQRPVLAANATDTAVFQALCNWRKQRIEGG